MATVEQFDTLVDMLTVRQMLLYTAQMKLDHGSSIEVRPGAATMPSASPQSSTCQPKGLQSFVIYTFRSWSLAAQSKDPLTGRMHHLAVVIAFFCS